MMSRIEEGVRRSGVRPDVGAVVSFASRTIEGFDVGLAIREALRLAGSRASHPSRARSAHAADDPARPPLVGDLRSPRAYAGSPAAIVDRSRPKALRRPRLASFSFLVPRTSHGSSQRTAEREETS